jgi:hypothetical protein
MKKTLKVSALLCLSTGKSFGPFDEMHEAAEWVMGGPIWTHEFASPELWKTMRENVLAQFPGMFSDGDAINEDNAPGILREQITMFGETLEVEQGTAERTKSPMETLQEVAGDKPVIMIQIVDPEGKS